MSRTREQISGKIVASAARDTILYGGTAAMLAGVAQVLISHVLASQRMHPHVAGEMVLRLFFLAAGATMLGGAFFAGLATQPLATHHLVHGRDLPALDQRFYWLKMSGSVAGVCFSALAITLSALNKNDANTASFVSVALMTYALQLMLGLYTRATLAEAEVGVQGYARLAADASDIEALEEPEGSPREKWPAAVA